MIKRRLGVCIVLAICAFTNASGAQDARYKPPAKGTVFEYNNGSSVTVIDTKDMEMTFQLVNSSGTRTLTRYAAFQNNLNSSNEPITFPKDKLDALWPLAVGKETSYQWNTARFAGVFAYKVARMEEVSVPAGKYQTYVIEIQERGVGGNTFSADEIRWFAPEIGVAVKTQYRVTGGRNAGSSSATELTKFSPPR
jgi:hypothetical protein